MMKSKKRDELCTVESVGIDPRLYQAAVRYLFDRPVPRGQQEEWFWNIDEPDFQATPLEWTRIQAVLFANAGRDLAPFDDEQVGMGLNYVMSNAVSDVPFAAIDAEVPLEEAMRMMRAMPALWRDCIGPRLASVQAPIGSGDDRLGTVCYMWFDAWPTFRSVWQQQPWKDAMWAVLSQLLAMPWREVQVAALHGIGHHVSDLDRTAEIDRVISEFVQGVDEKDDELRRYAEAARCGMVQ